MNRTKVTMVIEHESGDTQIVTIPEILDFQLAVWGGNDQAQVLLDGEVVLEEGALGTKEFSVVFAGEALRNEQGVWMRVQ